MARGRPKKDMGGGCEKGDEGKSLTREYATNCAAEREAIT